MTTLVTGGTGFVGLNLTHQLVEQGEDARVLARQGSPVNRLPDEIETVEGDVTRADSLDRALAGVDSVVHLAARLSGEPQALRSINVDGTRNLVERCERAQIDTFVFASTIRAHPAVPVSPRTPYDESKADADKWLAGRELPFDLSVVYPTYIFGPRDYRLSRYHFFQTVASNPVLFPPLYRPQSFNVVHVDDVVDAFVHCLENEGSHRYAVTGENRSSVFLARSIADLLDVRCHVVPVPQAAMNYVASPLLDLLHKGGYSPVAGSVLECEDVGVVPERHTNRGPGVNRSTRAALEDTMEWYDGVGLL